MGAADAIATTSADNTAGARTPVIVGFDGIEEVHEYVIAERILASVDVDTGLQGLRAWQLATGEHDDVLRPARTRTVITPRILSRSEILRVRERTKCFISYAHEERDLVAQIDGAIRTAGFSVAIDVREVAGGDQFASDFRRRIAESDVVLIVVSSASLASPYVADEMRRAVHEEAGGRLTVIPVLAGDVELPDVIRDHISVDFRDRSAFAESCRQLVRAITATRRGGRQ